MKVKSEVHIYRIDGEETKVGETTTLEVSNVWNRKQFVELTVTGGKKVVVKASDLLKAIDNATNNED